MTLPCPKCGNTVYKEEWRKSPLGVDFVYSCCGQRRRFYYGDNGWESQEEKIKRLEVTLVCSYCKETFTQPSTIAETKKKIRSTCDSCRTKLMKEANKKRESL